MRTKAAASREVTGDLGVAVEAVGIHLAQREIARSRSGRTRWGHRTQRGPQPPPHPPTVIHLGEGTEVALAGSQGHARALKAGERDRRAVRGQDSRASPGGSGGHGRRAPERYRSREAAGARPSDTPFPRGTAAQRLARRGPTVDLVTLYALTAQPLGLAWQTGQHQGSQGHGQGQTRRGGRGGASELSRGESGRRQVRGHQAASQQGTGLQSPWPRRASRAATEQ